MLKELNSARAQLERVLSLHDSVDYNALRMIAKFKIWGQKMYIFTFHIVKNHRKCGVFSSKISMITNVILILYKSSINNKLILRDLRFRRHIACFCYISQRKKIIPNSYSEVLSLSDSFNRLNDSVQSQRLTY